ncbi:hypothetical protein [Burkholderia pseudomallei]|uniref:hypothetical protein n=2 Tax=Burkholderia pseudomallei TaxID=28450 RepID=UPI001E330DC6|nr:hypothetical protein [Burkholderia pseudomallei]
MDVWCRWRLSLPLVLLSRREHAAKARGAPAIGGDRWRTSAGAVAAGISARFADALFDMHVGLGALHSSGVRVLLADEPTSRRADEPTSRRADEPTSRHADTPTRRHADTPTRRHADTPTRRHADGSTVPSVYESIPVSPMQSSRLTDSPIYRFASACRAAVPRPSGAERSIIGSRIHTTPTRRPSAVARPFEAARRRRHIRRASRPTAVHSLEAHRRRKP